MDALNPPRAAPSPRASQALFDAIKRSDLAALQEALAQGAPPDARSPHSLKTAPFAAVEAQASECLRALLEAGADPDAANDKGMTLAMAAAQNQSDACLRTLIDAGAVLDKKGYGNLTPLLMAFMSARPRCAQTLWEAGASFQAKSNYGWTAPMWLFSGATTDDAPDRLECARLLVKWGADFDERNQMGQSAWSMASPMEKAAIQAERERAELEKTPTAPPGSKAPRM